MNVIRVNNHDFISLRLTTSKANLNLSLSRSGIKVSGKGLTTDQMRKAMTWFDRIVMDKQYKSYGDSFDVIEKFLRSCTTIEQAIAGPAVTAAVKRMAAEVIAKTANVGGKYDHLYKAGMTAQQKQAVRAKARR